MKTFKVDINVLGLPLLVLALLIVITIIAGNIIVNNITRLQGQISDNQTMENTLSAKLSSLKVLTSPQTDSQLRALESYLPQTNPVFEAISKVQNVGLTNGLTLSNFNSSSVASSSAQIAFTAEGNYSGISAFISNLKNFFPVTRFDSIKILNQNLNGVSDYKLSATVFTYWSALPTVLPSIETPITQLTSDEQSQISKILPLQTVNLVSSASASSAIGKSNPFQ